MLSTDSIFALTLKLREQPPLAPDLVTALLTVTEQSAYREWSQSAAQALPYVLPQDQAKLVLQRYGLADGDVLTVRINRSSERVWLTDGNWVDPAIRAFPFDDESKQLVLAARDLGWAQQANVIVDLCGGVGHVAWSFDRPLQVLLDVNPRALAYAELNKTLNGLPQYRYLSAFNDIRQGLTPSLAHASSENLLVLANMPFGPAASASHLALTSYGGPDGLSMQVHAFDALSHLLREREGRGRTRALIMGMSPGVAAKDLWLLPELAREKLRHYAKVVWMPCAGGLLRLNGKRRLLNPSPLEMALPLLAECALLTPPEERESRYRAYQGLAREQRARGLEDLAFGIVCVEAG